jgi:hypoxanthine phosphoribosyltransferase
MNKVDLSFGEVARAISNLDLPEVDHVIGIRRGGVVPASLIAYRLGCDLTILDINYRDDENKPRYETPVANSRPILPPGTKEVLVVDDVSVSGSTLRTAGELLQDVLVTTLVLKGKADYVVFPEIRTCVNWPW